MKYSFKVGKFYCIFYNRNHIKFPEHESDLMRFLYLGFVNNKHTFYNLSTKRIIGFSDVDNSNVLRDFILLEEFLQTHENK